MLRQAALDTPTPRDDACARCGEWQQATRESTESSVEHADGDDEQEDAERRREPPAVE
jgi:hypothetical protein